jgi:hypothetical protein
MQFVINKWGGIYQQAQPLSGGYFPKFYHLFRLENDWLAMPTLGKTKPTDFPVTHCN